MNWINICYRMNEKQMPHKTVDYYVLIEPQWNKFA